MCGPTSRSPDNDTQPRLLVDIVTEFASVTEAAERNVTFFAPPGDRWLGFVQRGATLGMSAPVLLWGRVAGHSDSKMIIMWALVIAVLSVILAAVLISIRKRTVGDKSAAAETGGLMDELRTLRQSGKLSQEEFDKARAAWRQHAVESMDLRSTKPNRPTPHRPTPNRQTPDRPPPNPKPPAREADTVSPKVRSDGSITAPPGFDLTGAPLPVQPTRQPTRPDSPPHTRDDPGRSPSGGEKPPEST